MANRATCHPRGTREAPVRCTRALLYVLAGVLFVGALGLGLRTDAVLARCFPDGVLAPSNRYYASQWAGPFLGLALAVFCAARCAVRSVHRYTLFAVFVAYLVMAANFWRGYRAGWIPYADQCLYEEIAAQVFMGALFATAFVWEVWLRDRHDRTI